MKKTRDRRSSLNQSGSMLITWNIRWRHHDVMNIHFRRRDWRVVLDVRDQAVCVVVQQYAFYWLAHTSSMNDAGRLLESYDLTAPIQHIALQSRCSPVRIYNKRMSSVCVISNAPCVPEAPQNWHFPVFPFFSANIFPIRCLSWNRSPRRLLVQTSWTPTSIRGAASISTSKLQRFLPVSSDNDAMSK